MVGHPRLTCFEQRHDRCVLGCQRLDDVAVLTPNPQSERSDNTTQDRLGRPGLCLRSISLPFSCLSMLRLCFLIPLPIAADLQGKNASWLDYIFEDEKLCLVFILWLSSLLLPPFSLPTLSLLFLVQTKPSGGITSGAGRTYRRWTQLLTLRTPLKRSCSFS